MKTQLSTLEMLMKGNGTFILATFFVLAFNSLSFSQNKQSVNPNTIVIENGDTLHYFDVPGKPPDKFRAPIASPTDNSVILSNVPAYDWSFGCAATSAAMIAGYYDNNNYPEMYTGPTNGGVAPMNNAVWGSVVINGETRKLCPLSATRNGLDGRATRGHVDDYWIKYLSNSPDPYITNAWLQHAYEGCTGDFMKTNQSVFNNVDGSTRFYYWLNGAKWSGTVADDGGYGFQLFMDSRGYIVTERYTQLIYGYNGNTNGFSFNDFKQEIDDGNPVLIHVTGHTMVGYGYDDATGSIYIHDTWDYNDHQMAWGGGYPSGSGTLNHWGVTVLHLLPNIIYVKWDATGANDGTSWADAFTNLHIAITSAQPGNDIWVARGTYSPTGNGAGRYRHFRMKNEVRIYGGFEGTENPGNFNLFDRNFLANETILDGQNDLFHVFYNVGLDATALLDGFTIKNGLANGDYNQNPPPPETFRGAGMYNVESFPRIKNCLFTSNFASAGGGGMFNLYSNPAINSCIFNSNVAYEAGGGMFNLYSNTMIINSLFSGNTAGMGAGLANMQSHPEIINTTISGNLAYCSGGGIFNPENENSTVLIKNCIIWNNQVLNDDGNGNYWGHQICNWASNIITLQNTCINVGGNFHIFGTGATNLGAGCIFVDPLFVLPEPAQNAPTTAGNYRLQKFSPAIDAGNDFLVPAGITRDLDWNPRFAFLRVDMGAYEAPQDCLPPKNLAAQNITATSANLIWTPGGSETGWNLEWGPAGFAQGTGNLINNIPAIPFPLNGLSPVSSYEFYVQAVCGPGNLSIWAGPKSFTTTSVSQNQYDFGDAPDPGYQTLLPLGANHSIDPALFLGFFIDPETNGLPHIFALGDDSDASDDEDGIKFLNSLVPGQIANLEIQVTGNGFLNAWIDFDGNGSWAEPDNQILAAYPVVAGINLYSFLVPPTAVPGATFSRFRLSSVPGLGYDGTTPDGEVEDYRAFIHQPVDHKMHYPQYPDLNGWDVNITVPNLAADDFQCSKTGPVDNIYFWVSMKGDVGAFELDGCIDWINVSIHADIPAYQSPTGYSMPSDPPLWEKYFFDNEYSWSQYFQHPQGWYSPFDNLVLVQDHEQCFKINLENIENPFVQTNGTIYWLRVTIHSQVPGVEFGWKTSPDHWNDAVVWNYPFGSYPPLSWNKLTDPLTQESLDLAFYINNDFSASTSIIEDFSACNWPAGWTYSSTVAPSRWAVSNSAQAGGLPCEMKASWISGNGVTRFISPPVNTSATSALNVSFLTFFDDYAPGCSIGIQSSADGLVWTDEWSFLSGNGDIPSGTNINLPVLNNLGGITYIAWVINGDHYQFDYWYIDNIEITGCSWPTGYAGNDDAVCCGQPYYLFGTVAGNFDYVIWTTFGDGAFDNPSILNPVYIPGLNDCSNGIVSLTLTIVNCNLFTFSTLNLTINPVPIVICPPDITISISDPPIAIAGATPPGGVYSGPGMTGDVFDPQAAGQGDHIISYCHTDPTTGCFDCCTFIISVTGNICQNLFIPQGWSGISTWLEPQPADVFSMFAPCVNDLVVVKSGTGVYWPAQNINTIGNWDVYKGYTVKMLNDVNLQVCGQSPTSTSVALNPGWNLVPVLSSVPVDVVTVLGALPCVVVAKGITTGVYWPGYNINTIGSLQPGSAYWVYVTCSCTLTYPPSPLKGSVPVKLADEKEIISPWNKVAKTQSSHLIIIPASFYRNSLQNLILGAFTSDGMCVGMAETTSENTVISIYADDPTTPETDGMMEGEEIMIRIFDPEKGTDIPIKPVFDPSFPDADGKFIVNGLSMVDVKTSLPENETSIQVSLYPNPANDFVNIEVAGNRFSDATILFYDLIGQVVLQTAFQESPVTRVETNQLSPGIYQVVVQTEENRISRKLVIK